jgi:hypothetical protein
VIVRGILTETVRIPLTITRRVATVRVDTDPVR